MLEREISHPDHGFVRCIAIGFDNNGTTFFARVFKLRTQVIDRSLLIAKINRRPARNANDLVFHRRGQHEFRERDADRYSRLQNEVRAEKQEKNHEKQDGEQWENQQPPELILLRSDKFHAGGIFLLSANGIVDEGMRFRTSFQKTRSSKKEMRGCPGALPRKVIFPDANRAGCFPGAVEMK